MGFTHEHPFPAAAIRAASDGPAKSFACEDNRRYSAIGPRPVEKRVLVEEVRLGARRLVDLERPLVALHGAACDGDGEHLREAAGRLELAERLVPRLPAAQVEVERLDAGVPAHDRGVE